MMPVPASIVNRDGRASTTQSVSTTTPAPSARYPPATTWRAASIAPYLATLVATGRLDEDEAFEVASDLAYRLAKQAYRL
jgi:hypothetical protein